MKKVILVIIALLCVSGILADGAKYLIIAPDSFIQALQPLADWKTKKGVKAMVVPLSVTGNTASQVKNYILNAYNTWEIRPEYILLAGLGTVVPYISSSDDFFADMTGNYQIELSTGRFPCATISQCQIIVAKTILFERMPYMDDTTWYLKGTTIVNENNPPDPYFQPDCRYIRNLMLASGYIHVDSFISTAGHNATSVEDAITEGRTFVVYRGWAVTNWWSPFNVDPNRTNNGYKLPIVITGTDGPTMSLSTSGYLGDRFLNVGSIINPKGAVGYFSTTVLDANPSTNMQRGTVVKGFFKAIFEENICCMGDAAKRTKFVIDSLYGIQARYQEWNLFGDPELNLWTAVPKPLTVIYDSIINPTPCSVAVAVLSNGIAVWNALVCLMKDTTIYEYGNTDSNGIKVFSILPQDTGTISITVTARSCHPFEGVIRVLPEGIEERSTLDATGTTLEVYPSPAKAFFTLRLPQSADRSQIKIFDVSGKLVKEIEDCIRQPRNDRTGKVRVSLKGISPGIYFLRLNDEPVTKKLVITK